MSDYVISCCSTADLTKEHLEARDIKYIYFHYYLDDVEYPDDMWQSMPIEKFYKSMVDGAMTRTSQVNAEEFEEYFEGFLKEGKDIIHLCLDSGISGVINSAQTAQQILAERYPDRKIYVLDSLNATCGYGKMMDDLADLRDAGKTIDELRDYVLNIRQHEQLWFFSTDLTFFVRGGRISKTSGFLGSMLNICPLMNISSNGKLVVREKIRTKKKAYRVIVDKMIETATDGRNYSGKCYIAHSVCPDDAKAVADLVKENFPNLNGEPVICNIGPTIGSHTGPGTVVLSWTGSERIL